MLRCIQQPHCFLLARFHHPINTHHDCTSHLPITINNVHYNISNNNSKSVTIAVAGPCACRHKQACSLRMFHSLTFRFALRAAFCAGVDGIGVSASACSCAGPSVAVLRRRRFGHDSAGAPPTAVAGRPCFPARPITRRWLKCTLQLTWIFCRRRRLPSALPVPSTDSRVYPRVATTSACYS